MKSFIKGKDVKTSWGDGVEPSHQIAPRYSCKRCHLSAQKIPVSARTVQLDLNNMHFLLQLGFFTFKIF